MRRENWIKWDLDSRTGFRMASFFALHGSNGYGFFVVLIEQLYRAEDHKLLCKLVQKNANVFKLTESDAKLYLDSLIELGLFSTDENQEFIWSERVIEESKEREDHSSDVSEKRRDAANKRWRAKHMQNDATDMQTDANGCKGMPDKNRSDKNNKYIYPGEYKLIRFDRIAYEQFSHPEEILKAAITLGEAHIVKHKHKDRGRYDELVKEALEGKAFLDSWPIERAYKNQAEAKVSANRVKKSEQTYQKPQEAPRVQPKEFIPPKQETVSPEAAARFKQDLKGLIKGTIKAVSA